MCHCHIALLVQVSWEALFSQDFCLSRQSLEQKPNRKSSWEENRGGELFVCVCAFATLPCFYKFLGKLYSPRIFAFDGNLWSKSRIESQAGKKTEEDDIVSLPHCLACTSFLGRFILPEFFFAFDGNLWGKSRIESQAGKKTEEENCLCVCVPLPRYRAFRSLSRSFIHPQLLPLTVISGAKAE